MLELPTVTLVCVDSLNHALALRALARSMVGARFARALLFTDAVPAGVEVPPGVEIVAIPAIRSRDDYSRFVIRSLLPHVATSHALVVQWDGYVVNPQAWDPAFLDCDYLGAKWYWEPENQRVGNGGFSLRSRRLLEALQDPRIAIDDNEDVVICRSNRPFLEREHGIRFGSEALADRFSFEVAHPIGKPFGFHALYNFWRTVPADELIAMAPTLSDAIASSPQMLQLVENCNALGMWPVAAALARRVLAVTPDVAEVLTALANAERNLARQPVGGRNDPCPCGSGRRYKHCHGALASDLPPAPPPTPPDAGALVRAALERHQHGDLEGAERGYREALALTPEHPTASHYLGVTLYQRQRFDDALPLLEWSCATVPGEPEFHNNHGLALAAADRNDEAIAAYRRALALKPDHRTAWNNLGLALAACNQPHDAIAAYRRAIEIDPAFAQAHWNISLSLLAAGQFAEGWREYEWRLRIPELGGAGRATDEPLWDGKSHPGFTLLLTAEQGLGDALQFIRLAEPLAKRGIRVIVAAPTPLVRLLARARGVAAITAPGDPVPPHDATLPLLSLPGVLDVDPATLPSTVPYLAVDPERRATAAAELAPFAGRFKVGLAWAGNRAHSNDRRRSVPLATLAPLFALPGIAWFSLQKGEAERDVDAVPAAQAMVPLAANNTYDDTAARIAELDLVICVDTSIAHVAGGLGKPTWVLLAHAADWRWHGDATRSAWYPTARLFRQPRVGAWDAVVADVVAALSALSAPR